MVCNRAWWAAIVVTGALLVLGGCGDDGGEGEAGMGGMGGTGGGNNNVQPGQICARFAEIQCEAEANCCESAGRDQAACRTALANDCDRNGLDTIPMNAIVGFNAGALKSALDELEERNADCDPTVAAWAVTSDGFASSFNGTRAAGESCLPEGGVEASTSEVGAALASCMNSATTACLPTSDDSWTCAPRGAAGAPCFTDFNCQDSMYCDQTMAMTLYEGMCSARKAAGAECEEGNECASFICKDEVCSGTDDAQAAFCPN